MIHAHATANVANANPPIAGPDIACGEVARELVRGDAEGDDERQVEEQLERGRAPMGLARIPSGHAPTAVCAIRGGVGCHAA